MKTKLISAAALLVCMGAAQAQVSIYGLVDMSYGKNGIIGDTTSDFHSGGDNGSSQGNSATKIGLKGSTTVATGIKANFQLETGGIDSNGAVNAGGAFFNRQAWAGFSGAFGEVRLGRQDSVPFQAMVGFDFNGAANAASAQTNANVAPYGTGRQSRSLQYIAPAMGGLKAQFGFVPQGTVTAADEKATYSVGLNYAVGPVALGFAAESKRTEAASNFSSIAGSYDFGVAKAMASYANGGTDAKGFSVGVVAPVAGFNVGLTFAKNNDTKVNATEFYVNREVFKNTTAYFDFGNKDTDGTKTNAYALGMIYAF